MNFTITDDDKRAAFENPITHEKRTYWYGILGVKRIFDIDSGTSFIRFRGEEYDTDKVFDALLRLWKEAITSDETNKPFWKFVTDREWREVIVESIEESWGFKLV